MGVGTGGSFPAEIAGTNTLCMGGSAESAGATPTLAVETASNSPAPTAREKLTAARESGVRRMTAPPTRRIEALTRAYPVR